MAHLVKNTDPRRLAAGAFHNLVVSNLDHSQKEVDDDDKDEDKIPEALKGCSAVFSFGSRKNGILQDAQVDDDEPREGYLEPKSFEHFQKRLIFEVGCGGNTSVLLEKLRGKDGADVWVCGLGTCGRLGMRRPRTAAEAERLLENSGYSRSQRSHLMPKLREMWDNEQYSKWCSPCPLRVTFPDTENVISISCGMDHTLALTERGMIFAWGLGSFGNLGTGGTEDCYEPTELRFFSDKPVAKVAAGSKHSIAVTTADAGGVMYSWGHGGNGRLGLGEKCDAALLPGEIEVKGRVPMKYVAAGELHTASIDNVGNVWCWGGGSYGRTGHGEEADIPVPVRMQILAGTPCRQVELGTLHSIVLTAKGELYAWGSGEATGLMDHGGSEIHTPKMIHKYATGDDPSCPIAHKCFVQVAAGCFHSLALERHGEVYSWGLGSEGRLGLGASGLPGSVMADQCVPFKMRLGPAEASTVFRGWVDLENVPDGMVSRAKALKDKEEEEDEMETDTVRLIYCGGMHSCAVVGPQKESNLYLWGCNEFGQIGLGDTVDRPKPGLLEVKQMSTTIRVGTMALGLEHCVMISYGGVHLLFSWGRNQNGQLGLGNTEDVYEPTEIVGLTDAIKVGAGEDHTAVILETGEFYTWGLAECGKLGHGSGMKSGTQNYPRRVRTDEQLKHVACGAQHTAVLTSRGHLYTFGAGWYGRLGHGDMDNQYSLKHVEAISHRAVIDVQCGAYHTCIVTADRRLWQCGRDWVVCADDHVSTPQPLKKDIFVDLLAVGAMHTLCVTRESDRTELWGWGDNSKGQLGLDATAARIPQPMMVTHDWMPASAIQSLATGYAHSMALLNSGDVLAWGLRSGGRLGLSKRAAPGAPPAPGATKVSRVPDYVDAQWHDNDRKKIREKQREAAEQGLEQAIAKKAKVDIFGFMQKKLRDEDPNSREDYLQATYTRLEEVFGHIIHDIFHLWDPPAAEEDPHARRKDECNEHTLRQLQARLDRSLCKNLKNMGLGDTYPSIQTQIHPDVIEKLGPYEELLHVLQQHPCYLAKLAQHVSIVEPTTISLHPLKARVEPTMFMSIVRSLFASLRDNRIRHLLMAMMRLLSKHEIKVALEATKREILLFDPMSSKVSALFKFFVSHSHFSKLHSRLFDVDTQDSLVSIILDWTIPVKPPHKDDKDGGSGGGKSHGAGDDEVLFVMYEQDLLQFTPAGQRNLSAKEKEELLSNMSEEFQAHENNFLIFLGVSTHSEKADRRSTRKKLKTFGHFLEKFQVEPEIRAIWAAIRKCLQNSLRNEATIMRMLEKHMEGHDEDGEEEDPELERKIYEPILTLFLTAVFAPLCESHEEVMTARMSRRLKASLFERIHKNKPESTRQEVEREVAVARKKVSFNIHQLGHFMKRVLLDDWNITEQKLKKSADYLRNSIVYPFVSRVARDVEDKTETDLTLDLYESHYSLNEVNVLMGTSELLQLSNALWLFAEDIIDTDKELGPKEEQIKEDKLWQTLLKVQPLSSEDLELEGRALKAKGLWPDWMLLLAHRQSIQHNFNINPRFLQHRHDLCYCMNCQAPIYRSMAPVAQKRNKQLRLVRPYRPAPGVVIEGKQPFTVLAHLFVNKDLPQLRSKDFMGLKVELEECQKSAQDKIDRSTSNKALAQKEFALIAEIEKAKQATELLRTTSGIRPAQLVEYIFKGLEDREEQRKYLNNIDTCSDKIEKVQKTYKDNLKVTIDSIKRAVQASEEASVPIEFKLKAQEQAITLKLMRLERINRRTVVRMDGSEKFLPAATLSLGFLRAKQVVAWVKPDLPQSQYKRIFFSFTADASGDWNVTVLHKESRTAQALFDFPISATDIDRMQSAAKTAKFSYGNKWVIINAFNLLQLLARITADAC